MTFSIFQLNFTNKELKLTLGTHNPPKRQNDTAQIHQIYTVSFFKFKYI